MWWLLGVLVAHSSQLSPSPAQALCYRELPGIIHSMQTTRCLSANEWIKDLWYRHKMANHSAFKKEILPLTTR